MHVVDLDAAQADLPRLIDLACAGEDVVLARHNEPIIRLVAIRKEVPRRQRGSLEGRVIVPDSFFDPLPPVELKGWGQ